MKNIEVEVRAFISESEFKRLKKNFDQNAEFLNRHRDETIYFDPEGAVRLRREKDRTYFVHKSGQIHDRHREELEIGIKKKDFVAARKFLELLGWPAKVKWQRERFVWRWRGFKVYLDNTKGYGRMLELEAIAGAKDKEKVYDKMLAVFKELGVKPTPKEEINRRYNYYIKKKRI